MGFKLPDITVEPGGRKVRTDLRPYADEVVVLEPAPAKTQPKPKAKPKKAEADE